MAGNEKVDVIRQLRDIAAIIQEEIGGMDEKLQTRFQLLQLFKDLIEHEETLRELQEKPGMRQNYTTLLGKAIDAEIEEFKRFKHRFDLIEQSLALYARLLTEGKQGVDF